MNPLTNYAEVFNKKNTTPNCLLNCSLTIVSSMTPLLPVQTWTLCLSEEKRAWT